MEEEIALAQLRQCNLSFEMPASLTEFDSSILYELLRDTLTRLTTGNDAEETVRMGGVSSLPLSLTGIENSTRLSLLGTLALRLQEIGCDFVRAEHLIYPTDGNTKRIITWLVNELNRVATAKRDESTRNEGLDGQRSTLDTSIMLLRSVLHQCASQSNGKNKEAKQHVRPRLIAPATQPPFYAVCVSNKPSDAPHMLWDRVQDAFKAMQQFPCLHSEKVNQPSWRDIILASFQERNAVELLREKHLQRYASLPLMATNLDAKHPNLTSADLPPRSKLTLSTQKEDTSSLHLPTSFNLDAFFYNPSDDNFSAVSVGSNPRRVAEANTIAALQHALEAAEESITKTVEQAAQDEAAVLAEYNEAKKEHRHLEKTLSELTVQKTNLEKEMETVAKTYEVQMEELSREQEESQKLEELLAMMDTPEESETRIQNEIVELTNQLEVYREELQQKLHKIESKREELLAELRAVGGDRGEQLAQLRQEAKILKRQIVEKKRDVRRWREEAPVLSDGIDRSHFLHYIYDMTSNLCKQQTQITSVARDTARCNARIEEMEKFLRDAFAKREAAVYEKATAPDSTGALFHRLHKSILEIREGYRAVLRGIAEHGEMLLDLHRIDDQLAKLKVEVAACDTEKVEADLAALQESSDEIRERLQM